MRLEAVPDVDVVDRTALLARVLRSTARAIAITAPAGYGKSRFAAALTAALGNATPADAAAMFDVPTAVRELLRALGPFEREFELRQSRHVLVLPRDGSADERWRDVLDEALERPDGSRVLWVENGELLAGRPEVATLVDRALRGGRRRIVVCSRIPLALDSLARIPPNERYAIGTADLAFTGAEIAMLFAPLGIAGASLERVIRFAHGWPIAVLTFARAAREGRLIAALDGLDDGFGVEEMGEYTLSQGLGWLSDTARETLAAAAILGSVSDGDLAVIADDPAAIAAELDACPFVARSGASRAVHPLASAALTAMRARGAGALVRAAERAPEPIHAARLFLAAGAYDRAADVIDRFVAPFMMEEPTRDVASIVASLDESVLLRHPATWNATWINRAYTVTPLRMLRESRIVWTSLPTDAPIGLVVGVGLSFLNWLFYLGHTDESEAVLATLDRELADHPPDHMMAQLVETYHQFTNMRRGFATTWPSMIVRWDATFGSIPMVAAMGQYALKGPYAFFNGDRAEAKRAFALGVAFAATAHSETVHVIAITNAMFYAWLAGESDEVARMAVALERASAPNVSGAIAHLLTSATGATPSRAKPGFELPIYRAYGWLIGASRETQRADMLVALRGAMDDANLDGSPWLRALVWIAVGLADPAQRTHAFERALAIAELIAYPAFRAAIEACTQGRIPDTWAGLRAFVRADAKPAFVMSLGTREVSIGDRTISLAPREAELLLALALHDGPRDRATLAAMIWPDVRDKGTSNVGVYVMRLRRRLAEFDVIETRGSGYRLSHPVHVDLLLMEAALQRQAVLEPFAPPLEEIVASRHVRLPQWLLTSPWLAPYGRRYEFAIRTIRAERLADAVRANDHGRAVHYRALLRAEEDGDG